MLFHAKEAIISCKYVKIKHMCTGAQVHMCTGFPVS